MIIVGHPDKTVSKGDIFNETLAVRKHINGGPRIWADFVGDWSDMSEGTHASRGDQGSANMARSAHTGRTGIIRVKVRKGRIRTVILREVQWGERIGLGMRHHGNSMAGSSRGSGRDQRRNRRRWRRGLSRWHHRWRRRKNIANQPARTKKTTTSRVGRGGCGGAWGGGGGTTTRGGERFGNNGEAGGNQTTCSKVMMIAAMNGAFELLHSPGLGGIEGSRPNPCGWGG
jgi:hypothetical protein